MSDVRASGPDGFKAWLLVEQTKTFCYVLAFVGMLAVVLFVSDRQITADIEIAKIAAGCKE